MCSSDLVATPPQRAFSTPGARHAKPKRGRNARPGGEIGFQDSNAQQWTNSANLSHPCIRRAAPRRAAKGQGGVAQVCVIAFPLSPAFPPPYPLPSPLSPLPSPQKPALNPALRVWPGKAKTPFPPKGRTNPSPSLERRRDARDSPKENKGKQARRVDVQNTMKPQVTTLIQPQPRCRESSKRRNPTLQRPLERFSFDFSTPAQTTGRRGVSASRMLSFF